MYESGCYTQWRKVNKEINLLDLIQYARGAAAPIRESHMEFLQEVQSRLMASYEPEPLTLNKISQLLYLLITLHAECLIPFFLDILSCY